MKENDTCDFCGWATRNNVRCSDGRTIMQNAFEVNDGQVVPLVWNHRHDTPENVLGHALLENRADGVYVYGTFNDTERGKDAKKLVEHGDIRALSIYANQLKQQDNYVIHGNIREVSLVHAGANPKAFIENVISHGDIQEDEAKIYFDTELELYHAEDFTDDEDEEEVVEETIQHEDKEEHKVDKPEKENEETIADVFETLSEKQKTAVYFVIAKALEDKDNIDNNEGGDSEMKHNVFDNEFEEDTNVISHADQVMILEDAKKTGVGSFQAALKNYVDSHSELAHGYSEETITALFPDDQLLKPGEPEKIPENDAWVSAWMNKTHKSPFNRVKTRQSDVSKIRAGGYKGKGNKKVLTGNINLVERVTHPQTVYVKDELNRDDIIDITDFDIVNYEHNCLRGSLNTELARASLFGDGRKPGDEQKINPENIRPVWSDDEVYTIHKKLDTKAMSATLQGTNTAANFGAEYIYAESMITAVRHALEEYKGSGKLVGFVSTTALNTMMLARDMNGRRIYDTEADLAKALHVDALEECDEISGLEPRVSTAEADRGKKYKLELLLVNPADYNYGATRGGQVSQFSDFDIDFNKYKYLIETRLCGALTRVKSAIAIEVDVSSEAATIDQTV